MGDGIVRGLRWVFKVEICCGWGELDSARVDKGTILFLIVGLIGQWRDLVAFLLVSGFGVAFRTSLVSTKRWPKYNSQHFLTAEGHCPTD